MADETDTPNGTPNDMPNDAGAPLPPQGQQPGQAQGDMAQPEGPHIATLAQYVKDLSVENPGAPKSFQYKGQPNVSLGFNIEIDKVADDVHEVSLKIEASSKTDEGVQFIVDLKYAGLFGLRGIPEQNMQPILLVELPRLIFPFARQVIADATANAGFAPLMLDPIDFGAVYMQRMQQMQAEQAQAQAQAQGGMAGGMPDGVGGDAPQPGQPGAPDTTPTDV